MSGSEIFDDDYSETGVSLQGETLTDDEILLQAIDTKLMGARVAVPAKVTKVRNNSYVDIQIMILTKFKDGTPAQKLPIIQMVPVKHLSGVNWWFKGPVAVGDDGTALVHDRSLDAWKVQGGFVDPQDTRNHDLSDAEFIPGLRAMNKPIPGAADEMILHNGSAEVVLQPGGKFKIKNDSAELISLIDDLVDKVQSVRGQLGTAVSNISAGPIGVIATPAPGSPVPTSPGLIISLGLVSVQLSLLQTQISTLKTSLETLKGS